MLEIFALIFLAKKNADLAAAKGRGKVGYVFMTIGLWVGGEIFGFIIGSAITEGLGVYFFGIIGAVIGAVISYQIAKNLKSVGYSAPGSNYWQNDANNTNYYSQPVQNNYQQPAANNYQQPAANNYQRTVATSYQQPVKQENNYTSVLFEKYYGTGVCDVCNKSILSGEAFKVPVDTFYASPKYKAMLASIPLTKMAIDMYGGVDAYLRNMRANDQTSHSAVCPNCIHLFK